MKNGKKTKVYHADPPRFSVFGDEELLESLHDFPSGYELAATADFPMLDLVYQLTNSIDWPWWENEGVTMEGNVEGRRSTSVGDVIVIPDGSRFVVALMGFKQF